MQSALHPDVCVFFFNDTATTEIYTLSLHDALPIYAIVFFILAVLLLWGFTRQSRYPGLSRQAALFTLIGSVLFGAGIEALQIVDRKSTRLNSSHANISYAVFCLKKKHNQRVNGVQP